MYTIGKVLKTGLTKDQAQHWAEDIARRNPAKNVNSFESTNGWVVTVYTYGANSKNRLVRNVTLRTLADCEAY